MGNFSFIYFYIYANLVFLLVTVILKLRSFVENLELLVFFEQKSRFSMREKVK